MKAWDAYDVGMKCIQYTVRGVPDSLNQKAREEAEKYHKSMNALLLDVLARGLGVSETPVIYNDMDDLAGTWVEDEAFDEAVSAFEVVDADLWK